MMTPIDDVALIYIRQSRNKRYERTVSPETQESACRALPAIMRCSQVEVYRDLDLSGKSIANRPEFQAFLRRIQERPPKVVAAYDQSRSFRNTTEALDFFALMERLTQVEVVFHIGHFERSPVGEFSYTTLAAAHTMEREDDRRQDSRLEAVRSWSGSDGGRGSLRVSVGRRRHRPPARHR
jgi:DNA invertase Pin-like site-specific DNA recombinase